MHSISHAHNGLLASRWRTKSTWCMMPFTWPKRKKREWSKVDTRFPVDTSLSSDIISRLVGLSLNKIAGLIMEDYACWTWQNTCTYSLSIAEQRKLTSWMASGRHRVDQTEISQTAISPHHNTACVFISQSTLWFINNIKQQRISYFCPAPFKIQDMVMFWPTHNFSYIRVFKQAGDNFALTC